MAGRRRIRIEEEGPAEEGVDGATVLLRRRETGPRRKGARHGAEIVVGALEDPLHGDGSVRADKDLEHDLGLRHTEAALRGGEGDGGFVDEARLGVQIDRGKGHLCEGGVRLRGEVGPVQAQFGFGLERGLHRRSGRIEFDLQVREIRRRGRRWFAFLGRGRRRGKADGRRGR
jgi:hypothetical protein